MSKIKNRPTQVKIQQEQHKSDFANKPIFSFTFLTSNKNYNFEYFTKQAKRDCEKAKAELYDRLIEICKHTWLEWQQVRKNSGLEYINSDELNFKPNGYEFSPDEKVIIFRFNSDYRIIGFKGMTDVYYIIGFDFNYSAYDHGS